MPETTSKLIEAVIRKDKLLHKPSIFDHTLPLEGFSQEKYLRNIGVADATRQDMHLILSGGGMKSSLVTGALVAFLEKFGLSKPSNIIAASGNVGAADYFIAGQYYEMVQTWAHLISNPEIITKKPSRLLKLLSVLLKEQITGEGDIDSKRIIDVRNLVSEMSKQAPLKAEEIVNSPIDYSIATTKVENGEIIYINNHSDVRPRLNSLNGILNATMASKSIPVLCGQQVKLKFDTFQRSSCFSEQSCIDTISSCAPEIHIKKAIRDGARAVLAFSLNDPAKENPRVLQWWKERQTPEFLKTQKLIIEEREDMRARHRDALMGGILVRMVQMYSFIQWKWMDWEQSPVIKLCYNLPFVKDIAMRCRGRIWLSFLNNAFIL